MKQFLIGLMVVLGIYISCVVASEIARGAFKPIRKDLRPPNRRYYLSIRDSSKRAGRVLRIDSVSSDTAFCSWYSK